MPPPLLGTVSFTVCHGDVLGTSSVGVVQLKSSMTFSGSSGFVVNLYSGLCELCSCKGMGVAMGVVYHEVTRECRRHSHVRRGQGLTCHG